MYQQLILHILSLSLYVSLGVFLPPFTKRMSKYTLLPPQSQTQTWFTCSSILSSFFCYENLVPLSFCIILLQKATWDGTDTNKTGINYTGWNSTDTLRFRSKKIDQPPNVCPFPASLLTTFISASCFYTTIQTAHVCIY
jgi:hypothetical protein